MQSADVVSIVGAIGSFYSTTGALSIRIEAARVPSDSLCGEEPFKTNLQAGEK